MTGIYLIENLVNGKVYIGQSINIGSRWKSHIRASKSKKSNGYNYYIHKAFRKYGINNFKLVILEECEKEYLNEKEMFWIRVFNSEDSRYGYNLTHGGDNTCSRMRRPVLQIDLETKAVLHEYESCFEAGRIIGENQANIRHCCNKKYRYAYGFLWVYKDEYDKEEIRNRKINKELSAHGARAKLVHQYNKETGAFIRTYIGTNEASQISGVKRSGISNCLAGLAKSAGNYLWSHTKEDYYS